MTRPLWLAATLVLCLLPACAPASPSGRVSVLATTTILADLAKQVAGERLVVGSIAPAGAHVEEYEPKPDDAKRVSEARLIIVNGLDLDKWVEPVLRNATTGTPVLVLTEGLPEIEENPHMWFDASLARKHVESIRDALIGLDPEGRDVYTSRAKAYDAELEKLDAEIRAKVATVPRERRKLVTSHDQFPYFAKAYGFEVVGFVQPEPGKPPSAGELAELVGIVKEANVPAIFSEAGTSPQLAETLAREAGVKKVVTDLPTDSLLDPPGDTYIGYMRVLVDKIVAALR